MYPLLSLINKSDPIVQTVNQDFNVIDGRLNNSQLNIYVPPEMMKKNELKHKEFLDYKQNKGPSMKHVQVPKGMHPETLQNRKSSVSSQIPNSEAVKLNGNLESFNPVENIDVRSVNQQISDREINRPYQFNITASNSTSINTPMRMSKIKGQDRKMSARQSDPSPIVFKNNEGSDYSNSSKRNQKHMSSSNIININSNKSPPVVIYANSSQESNEGKLIRKLGEKQKMLEKYETMLKKVNSEFQNTLNKNKELNDEISLLEMRLQRSEEKQTEIQGKIDIDRYTLQRQLDELIL